MTPSYKGVTDLLTLYLWRKPAFYLTRWAARGGAFAQFRDRRSAPSCASSPSICSGAAIIGGACFPASSSWCSTPSTGSSRACTGASSKWGNVFDHGIDLIHPPFWWWAWLHGLAAYGRPLDAGLCNDGAVGDHRRLCRTAASSRAFSSALRGHAHPRVEADRQPVPADHRAAQPEHGDPGRRLAVRPARHRAELVAWWTIVSLIFHAVRLAQASERGGARAEDRVLAGREIYRLRARRVAARARSVRGSSMTDLKALIPVGGEPMVRRPVQALLASPEVGDVIVLTPGPGDRGGPARRPADAVRESGGTIAATIARATGVDAARNGRCWSRPPTMRLLDAAMIDEFSRRRKAPTSPSQWSSARAFCSALPRRSAPGSVQGRAYSGANLFAFGSTKVPPAVGRGATSSRTARRVGGCSRRLARHCCLARCSSCAPSTKAPRRSAASSASPSASSR